MGTRRLPNAVQTSINEINNDVDLLGTLLNPVVAKGEAGIDISEAVYTGFISILTITPEADKPLLDLQIDLAYNKAATGVSAVATNNDTLDVQVLAKVDDSNYARVAVGSQVTLTATVTPLITGERFKIGIADGVINVLIKLSAERADALIPYKVTYRSKGTPTITPVVIA